jgi:hypothetical protein
MKIYHYDIFGRYIVTKTELEKMVQANNLHSRRFWVVVFCCSLILAAMILDWVQWMPVITILAGGVVSWLAVTTFFKEKKYKIPDINTEG